MNGIRMVLAASLLGLAAGAAWSQAGPGPKASGPAASAPGMGMGPGARAGRGMGGRWGPDHTPGWSMMSEQERNEHRDRMHAAGSYEACKAEQDRHHALMVERAKEQGGKPLARPRHDACAGLKR